MSQTLLIVDDEADIVALLKDYFELGGYSVLTAGNGYEALQQMEKSPDLVLLDINMPEMDGLAVCAKIRRFAAYPILFLTAKAEDADKIIGFRTGGDDYIVKPFSIEELGARVAAHLRREERSHSRSKAKFAGDLVIDYGERAVFYRNEPVPLAKKNSRSSPFCPKMPVRCSIKSGSTSACGASTARETTPWSPSISAESAPSWLRPNVPTASKPYGGSDTNGSGKTLLEQPFDPDGAGHLYDFFYAAGYVLDCCNIGDFGESGSCYCRAL